MCTWASGTEKRVSRGYRSGIAKIQLVIFQFWYLYLLMLSVVLCQKAASWNNSKESAMRQAKQCKFTWGGQWKLSSATAIICQCHKEASLNNSTGEIKSAERQSKWRKFKWRVNENMQGKDVQAPCETNVFLLLRIPFSADHSMGSRRALSEEHVPNTR